jgi:hypothetical protein
MADDDGVQWEFFEEAARVAGLQHTILSISNHSFSTFGASPNLQVEVERARLRDEQGQRR